MAGNVGSTWQWQESAVAACRKPTTPATVCRRWLATSPPILPAAALPIRPRGSAAALHQAAAPLGLRKGRPPPPHRTTRGCAVRATLLRQVAPPQALAASPTPHLVHHGCPTSLLGCRPPPLALVTVMWTPHTR
uniref:Uncharacterized protein n=1 Tax=Oryza sativa subsp. japonica TaxID=39947 RepID=Q6YUK0_ORYSJ|nr:hypothetical protein [Oryza sativa Japonica Group]